MKRGAKHRVILPVHPAASAKLIAQLVEAQPKECQEQLRRQIVVTARGKRNCGEAVLRGLQHSIERRLGGDYRVAVALDDPHTGASPVLYGGLLFAGLSEFRTKCDFGERKGTMQGPEAEVRASGGGGGGPR